MQRGAIDDHCGISMSRPPSAVSPSAIAGMIVLVTQIGTL